MPGSPKSNTYAPPIGGVFILALFWLFNFIIKKFAEPKTTKTRAHRPIIAPRPPTKPD
jgi:hypothetical protein